MSQLTMVGALSGLAIAIILIIIKIPPVFALLTGALIGGLIGGFGLDGTIGLMAEGAKSMFPSALRILTSGVLVGALVKTGSTDKIAGSIIRLFGAKYCLIAVALATGIICGIGVFIPIAVLTVAPIALEIGRKADISVPALLLAMIGGGKAGNIVSPNPNTIAAAEAFNVDLTSVMFRNALPALCGLAVTVIISMLMAKKDKKSTSGGMSGYSDVSKTLPKKDEELPALWQAVIGPIVVIILLVLRPICGVNIDPLAALPIGGIVCIIAAGGIKKFSVSLEYGLSKVAGVCLLLVATGTIAGVIDASTLKDTIISLLEVSGLPVFLLAPISGMLLAAATASTTAGVTISAGTFASSLLNAGVSAVPAAAMINASATIIDSMPHGSFFHASAEAVNMSIKDRIKMLPYEAAVGLAGTLVSMLLFVIGV